MSEDEPNSFEYVDYKKIGTERASRFIDRIYALAETVARKRWAARKNKSKKQFSAYIVAECARVSRVRNLLLKTESGDLNALYSPSEFEEAGPRDTIGEERFLNRLEDLKRLIVTGTAGAGKTMFLRKAFLTIIERDQSVVPVLIELRDLNIENESLVSSIHGTIARSCPYLMPEQLAIGFRSGLFVLLLDALDEINPRRFAAFERELLHFSKTYPETKILLTSRPLEKIHAWQDFFVFPIAPLTYYRLLDLVEKLPAARDTRERFAREIEARLWNTHHSFIEVPLLALLMFITYTENGTISDRLPVFYEDAFAALFIRHDLTKEGYEKHIHSGLSRDAMRTLLCALSLVTYFEALYSFGETQVLQYIARACRITAIQADPGQVLEDLVTSICILARDGNVIEFSHRSFQEYFCALFITLAPRDIAVKLLDNLADRGDSDNTLMLCKQINQELFERYWALPLLLDLIDGTKATRKHADWARYIKAQLGFSETRSVITMHWKTDIAKRSYAIRRVYGTSLDAEKLLKAAHKRQDAWRAWKQKSMDVEDRRGTEVEGKRGTVETFMFGEGGLDQIPEIIEMCRNDMGEVAQLRTEMNIRFKHRDGRIEELLGQ